MEIKIKVCPLCEDYNGVHACSGVDGVQHECENCAWMMQCKFRVCNLNFPVQEEICAAHKAVGEIFGQAAKAVINF